MRMIINIYNINENYLRQCYSIDNNVMLKDRPYVGIVLEINGFKYFAPFTSAKESRSKLNNQLTLKLFSGDEFLGAIRFNNMLPCKDEHLTVIEIKNIKNDAYRSLLNKQYELINYTYKDKILEKAIKCYKIKTNNPSSYNASLCINFGELEKQCNNL